MKHLKQIFSLLIVSTVINSCYHSLDETGQISQDIIYNNKNSLEELFSELDKTVRDTNQVYKFTFSRRTTGLTSFVLCKEKGHIKPIGDSVLLKQGNKKVIRSLIPTSDVTTVYFRKNDFMGFKMRGVRNKNNVYQYLFYFVDSAKVSNTLSKIEIVNKNNSEKYETNNENDLLIFHDKNWAFTYTNNLFKNMNIYCEK